MHKLSLIPLGTAVVALAGLAAGQSSAGSEQSLALAHGLMSSGGAPSTPNHTAATTLGQTLAGVEATSTNFILRSGIAWTLPQVTTPGPIVFGAIPRGGGKDGGETVSIVGYNFLAPGAGALSVDYGSSLAPGTTIVSNTEATTTTPIGTGPLANPIAETSLSVTNLNGTHRVSNGFTYLPALVLDTLPSVGGRLEMRLQTHPGDVYFLVMGKSVPGIGIPFPPWDGSIEVLINVELLQGLIPVPTGVGLFQLDIPDDPALAGGVIEFQALTITTPVSGSFSNLLQVTILP